MPTSTHLGQRLALYWLALGAFAIGTEGFMIAGLLPDIASDVSVSIQAAGQLVTAFSLAYAISSPVLTALTGNLDRRKLLIAAMAAFAATNVLAWAATGFWGLLAARLLLAVSAGLYMPNASALASVLVTADRHGRALAIVNGGTTIAIALGVPLGAIVGDHFGWRLTFAAVALLSAVATAGLLLGLPKDIGKGLHAATLKQRIAVARRPEVLIALGMTTLWAMGGYTVYTYLSSLISATTTGPVWALSLVLFTWGAGAAVGVHVGGRMNDKLGARAVLVPALGITGLSLLSLSITAYFVPRAHALTPVFLAVAVWGIAAWTVHPTQMARLIGVAGPGVAPVALSLNASFLYLGFALGAALGSLVLASGSFADLGWVGAICEFTAAILVLVSRPRPVAPVPLPSAQPSG